VGGPTDTLIRTSFPSLAVAAKRCNPGTFERKWGYNEGSEAEGIRTFPLPAAKRQIGVIEEKERH
jgi:hypothetical protein